MDRLDKWNLENIVALKLSDLAKQMSYVAFELRDIGTGPAKQHAKQLDGAARMVKQWAREVRKTKEKR